MTLLNLIVSFKDSFSKIQSYWQLGPQYMNGKGRSSGPAVSPENAGQSWPDPRGEWRSWGARPPSLPQTGESLPLLGPQFPLLLSGVVSPLHSPSELSHSASPDVCTARRVKLGLWSHVHEFKSSSATEHCVASGK